MTTLALALALALATSPGAPLEAATSTAPLSPREAQLVEDADTFRVALEECDAALDGARREVTRADAADPVVAAAPPPADDGWASSTVAALVTTGVVVGFLVGLFTYGELSK